MDLESRLAKLASVGSPPGPRTRTLGSLTLLALTTCLFSVLLLGASAHNAQAQVYFHHGFSIPLYSASEAAETAWDEQIASQSGSDTIRIPLSWDAYQTGVNKYNQTVLDNIVYRVQAARKHSPYAFDPKALIQFELPAEKVGWMQEAGYNLQDEFSSEAGYRRYYPYAKAGQEAYGRAMAKALKYLYSVQISEFIETPNEPNLTNGPSDPVPPNLIGALAAYGVTYAAAEGLPLNGETGPAVLVGAVSAGQSDDPEDIKKHSYKEMMPADYYFDVQWWTNYVLADWWKELPGGPGHAAWLNGLWRASFHAYPRLGASEQWSCELVPTYNKSKGIWEYKHQDERGDLTGKGAYVTVQNRLIPMLNKLNNGRKWWITETGMTSYKTNVSETWQACEKRRGEGGSNYGKNEQKSFFQEFAYYQEWQRLHSGYPWSAFEGVTFFLGHDTPERVPGYSNWPDTHPAPPFEGFGAYWGFTNEILPTSNLSCAYMYCPKPAGTYFAGNY